MKCVFLGTTSEAKLSIIKECLGEGYNIIPKDVQSGIPDQPLDEEITITGAINRAKRAIDPKSNYDFSVGLEGGLTKIGDLYYLVCVVSIVDRNRNIFTGISKKIPLPQKVSERVQSGEQFGVVIREFEKEIDSENNVIKDLVEELINRTKSFSEAFKNALTQYETKTNNSQKP